MIRSQLFRRARDLALLLSVSGLHNDDGADKTVSAVYTRDQMSVSSQVLPDFHGLLNVTRGPTESFKTFGPRFSAQLS